MVDSWVLSMTVFDRVVENGTKVQRRIPSCLDSAFAVLKNDNVVPELVRRINDPNGVPFRDGLPYQNQLNALRKVVESVPGD